MWVYVSVWGTVGMVVVGVSGYRGTPTPAYATTFQPLLVSGNGGVRPEDRFFKLGQGQGLLTATRGQGQDQDGQVFGAIPQGHIAFLLPVFGRMVGKGVVEPLLLVVGEGVHAKLLPEEPEDQEAR